MGTSLIYLCVFIGFALGVGVTNILILLLQIQNNTKEEKDDEERI